MLPILLVGSGLWELDQRLDSLGRTLPRYVWSDLESFIRCGEPARGVAFR